MITLDTIAEFTWDFGSRFLLETPEGTYVWSDPEYGGDNTIRPLTKEEVENFFGDFWGRSKGSHKVRDYCGDNVKILQAQQESSNENS